MKEIIKNIIGFIFSLCITCIMLHLFFCLDSIDDIILITIGCTIGYWGVFFIQKFKKRKKSKNS